MTQKKGEKELEKEKLALQWMNVTGNDEDLKLLSFDDQAWLWQQLKKNETMNPQVKSANEALLTRHIVRQLNSETPGLWYAAIVRGQNPEDGEYVYPYQESGRFGLEIPDYNTTSIRLFGSQEAAQDYVDDIHKKIRRFHRLRNAHDMVVVRPKSLDNNPNGLWGSDQLERMNVTYVMLSNTDVTIDLTSVWETRKKLANEQPNFNALCPRTYSLLGKLSQITLEAQPQKSIDDLRSEILYEASFEYIGCAISEESYETDTVLPLKTYIPIEGQDEPAWCIALFTDWDAICESIGFLNSVYLCKITWEELCETNLPVVINGQLVCMPDTMKQLLPYTQKAAIAHKYIKWCYENFEDGEVTDVECERILQDIIAAPEVCKEFYACLTVEYRTDPVTSAEESRIVYTDAENGIEVLPGVTAKSLLKSELCDSPAAAYRVAALLYNDDDGSAKKAFENAELYH